MIVHQGDIDSNIERLDDWLRTHRPEVCGSLLPALSQKELVDFEQRMNCRLPQSFERFYQWRNGQTAHADDPFWHEFHWLRAGRVVETCETIDNGVWMRREHWWTCGWIPFLQMGLNPNYPVVHQANIPTNYDA